MIDEVLFIAAAIATVSGFILEMKGMENAIHFRYKRLFHKKPGFIEPADREKARGPAARIEPRAPSGSRPTPPHALVPGPGRAGGAPGRSRRPLP